MARLGWLHLSDLMVGPKGSMLSWPQVREEVERDLREMHLRTGPWDLVFISGDLTLTGAASEYSLLDRTLRSLWEFLRGLGSDPLLLTVPGNHDLQLRREEPDVPEVLAPYRAWTRDWAANAAIASSRRAADVPHLRDVVESELLPGDWSLRFVRGDLTIGIVGLNSSWWDGRRPQFSPYGTLTREQVDRATGGDARAWCEANSVSLLVTHHPPSELEQAGRQVLDEIAPADRFLLQLCGGLHAGPAGLRPGKRSWAWVAPSFFGAQSPALLGYTAAVLDMAGATGTITFHPRLARSDDGVRFALAAGAGSAPSEETVTLRVSLGDASPTVEMRGPAATSAAGEGAPESFVTPDGARPIAAISAAATLRGFVSYVGWMSFSPSGAELAVGLSTGELFVWEIPRDRVRWNIATHKTGIQDVSWSPDGSVLATQSDYHLRFWRAGDGTSIAQPPAPFGVGRCLAWSPDGILGSGGDVVRLWKVTDGQPTLAATLDVPGLRKTVHAMAWSSDGCKLAVGGEGRDVLIFVPRSTGGTDLSKRWTIRVPVGGTLDVAWRPGSNQLATAGRDGTVAVLDGAGNRASHALITGHTDQVVSVSFSPDGRLLASKSVDGTVRLYRADSWEEVARLAEPVSRHSFAGLAFSPVMSSPSTALLATLAPREGGVRLWRIDVDALLGETGADAVVAQPAAPPPSTVRSVSAKVVLIGEGRAGKSCVALRLASDRYEELASTHGMRFWSVPASALGGDSAAAPSPDEAPETRELVLWDLGGQSEYRLVHQLFLRDAAVALLAMEPGRGQPALDEIEGWLRRLPPELTDGGHPVRKILVGTKVDDDRAPVDRGAIEALVAREKLAAYVSTSARTGHGIGDLKALLARTVDWDALVRTSQPRLFQRIQGHVQALIAARRVVLPYGDFERDLRAQEGTAYDPAAANAVVSQLARQGVLADTRMADGSRALILDVEQIERYAGSLVVAARENRTGLPAVDLGAVLAARAPLPRMPPGERLPREQEMVVLDCVVTLLLERGLCMRHQGLLIFPSLFPRAQQPDPAARRDVALVYSFGGPVDVIYASLVSAVALARAFGPMRLWEDRAEFGAPGESSCGVRKVRPADAKSDEARGLGRLEVYFDPGTPEGVRALFVNVVDDHLKEEHAVELVEEVAITCACGFTFAESTVRKRIAEGDVICPECERRTPITAGARQAREMHPGLVERARALRVDMRAERQRTVADTKVTIVQVRRAESDAAAPVRILHLSDLHIGAGADPESLWQPLLADLRDAQEGLAAEKVDYLVVSGDITNRASPAEFDRARIFLSRVIDELGLTSQRCVIVPGNHDLDWNTDVYAWKNKRHVDVARLPPGSYTQQGDGYNLRDDARYPERFRNFSASLYHPLMQREYPLSAQDQCVPHLYAEDGLQILALNSAWEIDEYFQERSGINEAALSRGLELADRQIGDERAAGRLAAARPVLRMAVWHHPITGNEKIVADAFLARLRQAGVRLCLHGHVHEDRADLINYLTPTRRIHVAGAGSFGAPTADRPESVPRLYNLLELARDHRSLTVHTRCLRRQGGAWEGWAVWPGRTRGEKRSYYVVDLS